MEVNKAIKNGEKFVKVEGLDNYPTHTPLIIVMKRALDALKQEKSNASLGTFFSRTTKTSCIFSYKEE